MWSASLILEEAGGLMPNLVPRTIYVEHGSYGMDYQEIAKCPTVNLGYNAQDEIPPDMLYCPSAASETDEDIDLETRLEQWRELLGLDYSATFTASGEVLRDDNDCSFDPCPDADLPDAGEASVHQPIHPSNRESPNN